MRTRSDATLHLRHDGQSHEVSLDRLGVDHGSSDAAIRSAVARHFDVSSASISKLVVERLENGNITLRPEAVFG